MKAFVVNPRIWSKIGSFSQHKTSLKRFIHEMEMKQLTAKHEVLFIQWRKYQHKGKYLVPLLIKWSFSDAVMSRLFVSRCLIGVISPVFVCPQLAYLLSQFQYFVCPVGFNSDTISFTVECETPEIFVMQEYTLPAVLQNTLRWVRSPLPPEGRVQRCSQINDWFC